MPQLRDCLIDCVTFKIVIVHIGKPQFVRRQSINVERNEGYLNWRKHEHLIYRPSKSK